MMNPETIIRAWKDPAFRASLTPEQRAALPENPSGASLAELESAELERIRGGQFVVLKPIILSKDIQCITNVIGCLMKYGVDTVTGDVPVIYK